MIRLILLLLALAVAAPAAAQTVTLRAGDHAGFTRLVLRLPAPANWRFGRTDTGYELRIDSEGLRFDLSRVFDVIARRRVDAVWADPGSGALLIGVRCACHAVAFAMQPRLVVIDIRDGAGDPASGFERRIDGGAAPPLAARADRPALRPRPRPAGDAGPPPPPAGYDWRRAAAATTGIEPGAADMAREALRLRTDLEAQFGRAVARGLVEPAGPRRGDPPPGAAAVAPPAPPAPQRLPQPGHIRVLPAPAAGFGDLTADGRPCIGSAPLRFLREATPSFRTLAEGWSRVLDPFDRPDPAAAAALARSYLALGFGAEARAVLRGYAVPEGEAGLLDPIAGFLEGDRPGDPGPLRGMEACDSDAALWAMLTDPAIGPGQPVASAAVLRAFSALPLHLRRIAGPTLAERFLARTDAASARAVRDAIARPDAAQDAVRIIDSDLALLAGDVAAAEDGLRAVAEAGGENGGRALARLAESVVDRGGTLDHATLVALAAAVHERGGAAEAAALGRAYARALAAAQDFGAAFTVATASGGDAPAAVWSLVASRGTDAAVLRHAGTPPGAGTIPAATALAMAERHLALGLPELALAWAAGQDGGQARLLAARAALQQRDGRRALRHLAGIEDETGAEGWAGDRDGLRAAAFELLGETEAAVAAWAAAGEGARAARIAWRARDWGLAASQPEVALPGPGAGALLAAAAAAPAAAPTPALPVSLEGTRRALEIAGERRAAIEAMLAAIPPPEPAATGPPP